MQNGQTDLLADLLRLMAVEHVDYSIFWRRLSHWTGRAIDTPNAAEDALVRDLFLDQDGINQWLLHFSELHTYIPRGLVANFMLKTNPKYVLRNHLGELAIQAAQAKDFTVLAKLQMVLAHPFDEQPEHSTYADFPPDWAGSIAISCSS